MSEWWMERRYQARGTAHVVTCYLPGEDIGAYSYFIEDMLVSRSILHYPVGSLDHGPIVGNTLKVTIHFNVELEEDL